MSYSPISEEPFTKNNNYWAGAKKACADLGWHLPTDAELTAIYITTKKNSGIKSLLNMSTSYWSSSGFRGYGAFVWGFGNGLHVVSSKAGNNRLRCVK
ncbi:MAG: hypothetical protein PHC64_09680 [Candidatus Gastranaerophilales bacterium]|nr:hypothetical protein [Candidatus Gastranaerophilales bacterium]